MRFSPGFWGAPVYFAEAVRADGIDDYLSRGSLTGASNNNVGLLSFWVNFVDSDDAKTIYSMQGSGYTACGVTRNSGNVVGGFFRTTGNSTVAAWTTNPDEYTDASGWNHFLFSFVGGGVARHLVINGVVVDDDTSTASGNVGWAAPDIGVFAFPGGGSRSDLDLAEFYITNEYLDITQTANIRKFISLNGKPVNLGDDGSRPTGTAPLVYLKGPASNFPNNNGTGGLFTENGALENAPTSPSD